MSRPFSHRCFINFHDFFSIDFRIEFFIDFWWKMAPFWEPFLFDALSLLAPFSRPFPKVDFGMHFGRPLAHFGSLWAPFGSLLAPFGTLLAPFGSLLAPFWCFWAHFCSPLCSIFTFWGSPGFIFHICLYFRLKSYAKSYSLKVFIERQIIDQANRIFPKSVART